LATFIERSLRAVSCQPSAVSQTSSRDFDPCSVSRLHSSTHGYVSVQACRRRHAWTSNARNLRTKKESWLSMLRTGPGWGRGYAHLARCHSCFQNQIVKDRVVAGATDSVTIYRALYTNRQLLVCQWTEADKAAHPSWTVRCLTSLWPLAVADPSMGHAPSMGIEI